MLFLIFIVALAVILLFAGSSGTTEGFARGFALQDAPAELSDARVITHVKPKTRDLELQTSPKLSNDMLLLEDHLEDSSKRCKDCIRKFFLSIETLAEERFGNMDIRFGNSVQKLPDFIREIERQWSAGVDYSYVAQKIRNLRSFLTRYWIGV